jgi:hypothetical protein
VRLHGAPVWTLVFLMGGFEPLALTAGHRDSSVQLRRTARLATDGDLEAMQEGRLDRVWFVDGLVEHVERSHGGDRLTARRACTDESHFGW